MKSDSDLKSEVLNRLELEPKIDAASLGVSVQEGVVTLRGVVDSEDDRTLAERAVILMDGVKGLNDDELHVGRSVRTRPTDAQLESAATDVIQWLTTISPEALKITARSGWLKLEGKVEWRHQARTIEDLVRQLPGVRGVENQLTVQSPRAAA